MFRNLIKLAIVLLVVYALYNFVPVYMNYQQFKDDVRQTALFAGQASEEEVVNRVMTAAQERHVPLSRQSVHVRKVNTQTHIDAEYTTPIKFMPWYTYVWEFKVNIGQGGR
jgi:hypothetical protein